MYSTEFDSIIKSAVKNRRSCTDIMESQPVREKIDEILAALKMDNPPMTTDQEVRTAPGAAATTANPATTAADGGDGAGGGDGAEKTTHWEALATRVIKSNIELLPEPSSEAALTDMIVASPLVGKARGTPTTYVAILFDVKVATESITAPHIRPASLKRDLYRKLMGATMAARRITLGLDETHGVLMPRDVVFTLDGGKSGLY